MAVTIYTNRAAIGDGTLWNTSGTYRLKTGNSYNLWVKISDTATLSPSAPTASTSSNFFTVSTITTKKTEGYVWIGTIRLTAGTATTNTNQTLTIKYGSTNYTCNIRVNSTSNGFSTNPTLASNFTYDDDNHAPLTAWGASKSANLFWAMSTSNVVPPDSGWANSLSSFTSTMHNAGTYYLWYRMQSTSTTYNDVFPTLYGTSITVSKATLTCTGSSHSITYSDAVPTLSISYSGWKGDDGTSDLTTRPSITTTYTRGSSKGSYPTTVSGGSAINYSFSYVAGSITVAAKTANLGWGTLTWTYDGSTHSTTCGVSNLYGTDTCTVTLSGNSVGKNVGTATVTASSLSNSNYALPSTKTATLTITAKEVSLTWGTVSWTYDGSTHSTTCTAGSLITGDTCTVTLTGNSIGKNVGSATVTASSLSNSNYKLPTSGLTTTITITQRVATLSWGTTSWTYDGQAHSTTCTVSNLVSGDTCTVTLYNNSITNYGSVDVVATGLSNNNYVLPYSKINTGLTAGGRTTVSGGTVSTTGVNADTYFTINLSENISVGTKYIIECDATYPSSDIYWVFPLGQQNNSSLAWYLYQGHNTKVFTANDISWGTKRIFMDDNGGNGRTSVCSFSNFVVEHWDAASQNGRCKTISITKRAVTLTAANKSKTYGDANPTLTSSITSGSLVNSGDLGTLGATTTASQSSVVGTYTITPTYTANTNYTVTTANGTLTINKRSVTLTAANKSRGYGDANPSFTSSITSGSLVNSGDLGTLSGSCSATVTSSVGTYTITPTYTANSNYTVTTANGTLTINKATLTCTASSHSISYGAAKPTLSITYSGWKNSEGTSALTTVPTASTTYTQGSAVGSYPTTASGGEATNYSFSYVNGAITVAKRSVTITAADKTRAYNTANPTFTASITSGSLYQSGDLGTISASCTATTTSNVGTYTITPTYTANSNYTVTSINGTLTITKAPSPMPTSTATATKYVNQTLAMSSYASGAVGTVTYVIKTSSTTTTGSSISGSTLTCGVNNSGDDYDTVTSITITDPGNSNYSSASRTLNVTVQKYTATISFSDPASSVVYRYTLSVAATATASGGTVGSLSYSTTGSYTSISGSTLTGTAYSASNTDTITATLARTTTVKTGTKTRTVSVTKRTVTITWGTISWVYDGSAHSANPTLGNIYGSDVVRYTITGNSITHKGTTTATITALDNSNYQLPSSGTSATLTITQATTVLSITSITTPLRVAESGSVVATTNFGTIGYSSSNTSVATVSSSGVLYGVTSGIVTITVSVATNSYGDWTAATATTTLTIINGMKVYYDGAWKDAVPYVYFDGQWRKAIAYVHNGTTWKPC